MFTYCLLKGVNKGWLKGTAYSLAGRKGWEGLLTKINPKNQIIDVCMATDMSEDVQYFLDRPRVVHDQHGIGPFLLAGAEALMQSGPTRGMSRRELPESGPVIPAQVVRIDGRRLPAVAPFSDVESITGGLRGMGFRRAARYH